MARPVTPFIPEFITVHLGKPDQPARNVTVPFIDYIKNVASSEIYPTWPENAIRANVLAQISFALNRIYTEWYRSRGYDFDITNSTQFDMAYIPGRDIFENISQIVDEIFNDYVKKQGSVEPYFTSFCNGTTVTCNGLSQWGTVALADQGLTPYEILQRYYGDDIDIVFNAPTAYPVESYPGIPLRVGMAGNDVKVIQTELNRIRKNYPSIPVISSPDGIFGVPTENAVKEFQRIFNLTQDGIVGKSTWYKIKRIYTGVKKLGELESEGLTIEEVEQPYLTVLKEGQYSSQVKVIQYYLNILSIYYPQIPPVEVDGYFGPQTKEAVIAFQNMYGITPDGIVGQTTWNYLREAYDTIVSSLPPGYQGDQAKLYPGVFLKKGSTGQNVTDLQTYLSKISSVDPDIPPVYVDGIFGDQTEQAVKAIQKQAGLPVNGAVGPATWGYIAEIYNSI